MNGGAFPATQTTSSGSYTVGATSAVTAGQYSVTIEASKRLKKSTENHLHVVKCQQAEETITVP